MKRPSIQILQRRLINSHLHKNQPKRYKLPLFIPSSSFKITRNGSQRCVNNLRTLGGQQKNMQNVVVLPNGFLLRDFQWSPDLAKPSSPQNGNQNWRTLVRAIGETQDKSHLDRKTSPDHRCLQSSITPSQENQLDKSSPKQAKKTWTNRSLTAIMCFLGASQGMKRLLALLFKELHWSMTLLLLLIAKRLLTILGLIGTLKPFESRSQMFSNVATCSKTVSVPWDSITKTSLSSKTVKSKYLNKTSKATNAVMKTSNMKVMLSMGLSSKRETWSISEILRSLNCKQTSKEA